MILKRHCEKNYFDEAIYKIKLLWIKIASSSFLVIAMTDFWTAFQI